MLSRIAQFLEVDTIVARSDSIVGSVLVQTGCSFTFRDTMCDAVEWFPV